jgi:hypothetical protein
MWMLLFVMDVVQPGFRQCTENKLVSRVCFVEI